MLVVAGNPRHPLHHVRLQQVDDVGRYVEGLERSRQGAADIVIGPRCERLRLHLVASFPRRLLSSFQHERVESLFRLAETAHRPIAARCEERPVLSRQHRPFRRRDVGQAVDNAHSPGVEWHEMVALVGIVRLHPLLRDEPDALFTMHLASLCIARLAKALPGGDQQHDEWAKWVSQRFRRLP